MPSEGESAASGTNPRSQISCSVPTPAPTHPAPVSFGSEISRLQGTETFSFSQNGIWHTAPVSLFPASLCQPMPSDFLLLKSHVLRMYYRSPPNNDGNANKKACHRGESCRILRNHHQSHQTASWEGMWQQLLFTGLRLWMSYPKTRWQSICGGQCSNPGRGWWRLGAKNGNWQMANPAAKNWFFTLTWSAYRF